MFDAGRALGLAALLVAVSLVGCAGPDGSDAQQLREAAGRAVEGLSSPQAALEAGYEPDPFCSPDEGVHWIDHDRVDGELDVHQPEAVLFLPTGDQVDAVTPGSQRFLGVAYFATMEAGADQQPPSLLGVPLKGPTPGHTSAMPRHAELHVYLDEGLELDEPFPARLTAIDCPPGTTPPGVHDERADDGASDGEAPASCEEVLTGRRTHDHARVEIYLDSERPYDFSPERYQLADRRIHFEAGQRDAGGAIIHLHEAGATLGCVLETLGWNVDADRLVTDRGEVYPETSQTPFEVFENGQPSPEGFDAKMAGGNTYVLRYNSSAPPTPCPDVGGRTVHDHAQLDVRLNSSDAWDFSAPRYQNQAGFVHFEDGPADADGARIHVHEERPSLSCLFSTLGWETAEDRIETDTGHVFEATPESPIEVLVNGEEAADGFDTPIRHAHSYEIRWNATATNGSGG